MQKWIIIILLILSSNIVIAQGFGHCPFGNYPFGHCVISVPPDEEQAGAEGGADTFASQAGTPLIFDVLVIVSRPLFMQEETVKATIIIINKRGIPTKDTILRYYLLSPNGTKVKEAQEVFLPEHLEKRTFKKQLTLPKDTELGEWKFVIEFDPIDNEPIPSFVSFEVITKKAVLQASTIALVITMVLVGVTARKQYGKKRSNKRTDANTDNRMR